MAALALLLALAVTLRGAAADHAYCQYEIWLADQADSNNGTSLIGYGGYVHIYRSYDLEKVHETIDLGGEASSLCLAQTGSNPVRAHMLIFNKAGTHAVVAFVASGHVVIFRAKDRKPVACFRTTPGFNGLRQAHAAYPTGDNKYIVVTNQNGKKVERINVDWDKETYVHDLGATLSLYGNCTTPSGALCEDPAIRPDNAPICAPNLASPQIAYITLRGGGLFVIDYSKTPVQIVGEYDNKTIGGNGCGGASAGKYMYVNAGGGSAANLYEFRVYKLPTSGYRAGNKPNTPGPKVIADDPTGERDAHGAGIIRYSDGRPKYFWQPDRYKNVIDVYSTESDKFMHRIDLKATNLTEDPTPDALAISPVQDHAFISLRGPIPLSADPHVSKGSAPGLGVLVIKSGGRKATFTKILPINNIVNGTNRADPHGLDIRVTNNKCTKIISTRRRL